MAKRLGLLVGKWENFGITMQYIYIYIFSMYYAGLFL